MEFTLFCSDENQSYAIPNTDLEFASLCLRNALTLIEHYSKHFQSTDDETSTSQPKTWEETHERTYCNPSKAITASSFEQLKYAVLSAYSYVQICLGDYLMALKFGKQLANLPNLPDAYAYVFSATI